MSYADEPMARVSISRILDKVTSMESMLAVVAHDVRALHDELTALDGRTRTLEGDRFPWKVIGGLVAVITLILSGAVYMSQDNGPPGPPPGNSTTK